MRVALVHDHLNQVGGAEEVLKVLADLYPTAPIYTTVYDEQKVGRLFPPERVRTSWLQHWPLAKSKLQFYLPLIPKAIESLDLMDYDLVISSVSALAKGVKVRPDAVHLCYCHTPTRYLWRREKGEYIHPWQRNVLIAPLINWLLAKLKPWDYQAAQRVTKFVANSHFTADQIKRYYRQAAVVVYPPVTVEQFKITPLPGKQDGYFLIVSRLRPYKKVDLAIQAFNRLQIPLVIAGQGEDYRRLVRMARSNIKFVGYVSEEAKAKLLAGAVAFIHPQEEDLGIAAVQAMAAGRPVIAYGAGGALETVIPGVTGELFQEQTWEELADAVIRFQPEKYDPQAIAAHARQFSTKRFAEEIKKIVDSYAVGY